jgi:predicted nucleic acid-binding protein
MRIYLDTSALAKAYLPEVASDTVRSMIAQSSHTFISSLNITEMRCMLARRVRSGHFSADVETRLWAAFQADISNEVFDLFAVQSTAYVEAAALIDRIAPTPLRTLDALHLCIAEHLEPDLFITTDRQLAKAALTIGLNVDQLEHSA